ncbi:Multidrug resistance protein MdtK [Arsenophonus endosymbiont of Bemisia tabaci Q2]|nr:Multidrug resistance protein MdtK [Arsenophonus endosymbiont of Bemisia tabaci Q2]
MALTPVVAELNGSGRRQIIDNHIQQGLWLAFFLLLLVMAVMYNAHHIINIAKRLNFDYKIYVFIQYKFTHIE